MKGYKVITIRALFFIPITIELVYYLCRNILCIMKDRRKPKFNKFSGKDTNKPKPSLGKLTSKSKPKIKVTLKKHYEISEGMRLNRFLSIAGICSRRDADEHIAAGEVTVNGKVVTELGTKVDKKDVVFYQGTQIYAEKKVYLLLNKPKDYVTTLDDPNGKRTVLELVKNACDQRIYPVGRLDRMTTGVLLFTNDGELTARLTHPKYNQKKIYHVFLDKPFTKNDFIKLSGGVELEDGKVKPDVLSFVEGQTKKEVGVQIHSGKNRIVRRMFEHLGYKVVKLDRVYFGGLTKKNLPRGRWRFLDEKEVKILKMSK